MARFLKTKKEHIGLSPDSLYFRGEQKIDITQFSIYCFDNDEVLLEKSTEVKDVLSKVKRDKNNWINIYGLHEVDKLQQLTETLGVSQHVLADVLNTHARPKLVEHECCLYLSLKMLNYNEEKNEVQTENIVFVLNEGTLISFQERVGDVFNPVRERLQNSKRKIRQLGCDYLLFALIDIVIDNYNYIISRVGERIEAIDERLIHSSEKELLHQINDYKSELLYLRKAVIPCKELISSLLKAETDYILDDSFIYYQELQSNIHQAAESVGNYKEMLSDQLNIYHTNVSSKLNDVMKVLTIFSVIFIPLTFIAGIYGTNFEYIPELKLKFGYFGMLVVMIIVTGIMLLYFKRKKWL